jgi:RND family efflux transporter MFP subunit
MKSITQEKLMKRIKITAVAIFALAAIVAILIYNKKSRAEAIPRPDILRSIPVTISTVAIRPLTETLSLVGTTYANNDVNVISETQGRVTSVLAKTGDFVHAGTALVKVDDELKRAAFASAEVNYEKAKKDFERYEALFKKNSITAAQFDGIRLAFKTAEAQYVVARRQLSDTRITSPIDGWVTARPVDLGTMIQPGTMVANVVDISTLKVKFSVSERDAFQLKVGDAVDVGTDIYPGSHFSGRILSVAAKGDDAHSYPVEIALANSKDRPLKAGMFTRVSFSSSPHATALFIPREALVGSIKKPQVFVVDGTVARLRTIVVGDIIEDALIVRDGLREGEQVVTNGQNNLRDSASVVLIK